MSPPPRNLWVLIVAFALVAGVGLVAPTRGQEKPLAKSSAAPTASRPLWRDLTSDQQEALAPLQPQWDTLEPERKRKWLELAARYPQLSPEGKQRFHERLPGFANLTPQQRNTARDNFRKAYELPLEKRQSVVEQYRQLPDDKKQELATQAKKPAEAPRRTPRATADDKAGAKD